MKKLNVVQAKNGDWEIVIPGKADVPLHYHIPYPETEWPEIGEVKGHKEMLGALYNAWQYSDELGDVDKTNGGDGLTFHTPFGDYATYSYHVGPVEEIVSVANKQEKNRGETRRRVEKTVDNILGWTPERSAQVHAQYGSRFDSWPRDLVREYWTINEAGHRAANAVERGDIEGLVSENLCGAYAGNRKQYVIRLGTEWPIGGGYFQSFTGETSGPLATAMRFHSQMEAEALLLNNEYLGHCTVVPVGGDLDGATGSGGMGDNSKCVLAIGTLAVGAVGACWALGLFKSA